MINLEDILLVIFSDKNVDTSNGHVNSLEGLEGKFGGFGTGIKEFNGTTKREVGTELIFPGNTAHGEKFVTNTKDSKIVDIRNELLEKKTFGFNILLLEIRDELVELLRIV